MGVLTISSWQGGKEFTSQKKKRRQNRVSRQKSQKEVEIHLAFNIMFNIVISQRRAVIISTLRMIILVKAGKFSQINCNCLPLAPNDLEWRKTDIFRFRSLFYHLIATVVGHRAKWGRGWLKLNSFICQMDFWIAKVALKVQTSVKSISSHLQRLTRTLATTSQSENGSRDFLLHPFSFSQSFKEKGILFEKGTYRNSQA